MKKIMITQSILWAAAIITIALVAPSESGWLLLTVLATIALGTLKKKKRNRIYTNLIPTKRASNYVTIEWE